MLHSGDIRPTTIQIFMPTGEPSGIRIAEITTRVVQAIVVPRTRLADANDRRDVLGVGVYFLVGEAEEGVKPAVYIGEGEDCYQRVKQHNVSKDFWNTAVVVTSKTASFTKSHAKYLEWHCLNECQKGGRYALKNSVLPAKPFVTEPQRADLMDAFDAAATIVSALGYPLFQPARMAKHEIHLFSYGPTGAEAEGELVDEGFVVFSGSQASGTEKPSTDAWVANLRARLVEDGVLKTNEEYLEFASDYLFQSPSAAGAVVRGHNVNGWKAWKDSEGRTLDEVYRKVGTAD